MDSLGVNNWKTTAILNLVKSHQEETQRDIRIGAQTHDTF